MSRRERGFVPTAFIEWDGVRMVDLVEWPEGGFTDGEAQLDTDDGSVMVAQEQPVYETLELVHNDDPEGETLDFYESWKFGGNELRQGVLIKTDGTGGPDDPNAIVRRIDLGKCHVRGITESAGSKNSADIQKLTVAVCRGGWKVLSKRRRGRVVI